MICPKCGNLIQKWAHGVCYTCERTEKEQQRFGRRRPKDQTIASKPKQSSLPEIVTCSACGQKVLTAQYASHWRRVHYAESCTSGVPKTRTKKRSGKQSGVMKAEARLARRKQRITTWDNEAPSKARSKLDQKVQTSRCDQRQKGINNLLRAIYGKSMFLSDILRDGGFSESEIDRLKQNHLDLYLEMMVKRWDDWWKSFLSARARAILVNRFGLEGYATASYESLAGRYRLTPEGIERSEARSIRRLGRLARRQELENIVVQTGCEFLTRI